MFFGMCASRIQKERAEHFSFHFWFNSHSVKFKLKCAQEINYILNRFCLISANIKKKEKIITYYVIKSTKF